MKEKQKDVVWPIRMSQELKDRFKTYCDDNGYSMNKLIKILIEKKLKMKNKWTSEEINFLKENYPLYGKEYCATKLNREGSSVFKKASRLNLKVKQEVKLANNQTAQIKHQLNRGNDDFNVNIEQFINITKPEVAYILGFLWADGYIVRNEIRLEIVKDDLEVVQPILESIGSWTYSYKDRARNGFKNRTIGRAVTSNKKLKEFLVEHDYDKKSYISADKILSKIPDELKHCFFRGLIDGDGCIYVNEELNHKRVSITSSVNQNWSYIETICNELKVNFNIYKKIGLNSSSMVEINGIHAKNFCDYIYQDKYFGLNRKYNKYLILVELFNNSKTILNNIKKNEALRLYNGGIPITKIIKATGIPNTTLRRFLSKIK